MHPEHVIQSAQVTYNWMWHVYELRFDRNAKDALLLQPDSGMQLELPRQDRIADGFQLHENCDFSYELSSYLQYLQTHHLSLFTDAPEVVHLRDSEEPETVDDDWDDDAYFSYHTLLFHLPSSASTLPCSGFSFIDDKLYSSVYLEVVESG